MWTEGWNGKGDLVFTAGGLGLLRQSESATTTGASLSLLGYGSWMNPEKIGSRTMRQLTTFYIDGSVHQG
eukprot:scaffold1129_cov164-Amphora_coffeaeformis.AAC.7